MIERVELAESQSCWRKRLMSMLMLMVMVMVMIGNLEGGEMGRGCLT